MNPLDSPAGGGTRRILGVLEWPETVSPAQKRSLVAGGLGWMLDAMDVMLYSMVLAELMLHLGHEQARGRVPELPHARRLGDRRAGLRRDRRPGGPHPRADGVDPGLLARELRLRPVADRDPARLLPLRAGARDGRGVDHRGGAHRRGLAAAAPRQGARADAVGMGDRRDDRRGRDARRAAALRLARGLLRGRAARPGGAVDQARGGGVADLARARRGRRAARSRTLWRPDLRRERASWPR